MLKFELRPSLRIVYQIAQIERTVGTWNRLSESSALVPDTLALKQLEHGAKCALSLDSTSPAGLDLPQQAHNETRLIDELEIDVSSQGISEQSPSFPRSRNAHPALNSLVLAHTMKVPFSLEGIDCLHKLITASKVEEAAFFSSDTFVQTSCSSYRQTPSYLLTPEREVVFPTVSAFLIEQRLKELLNWTTRELKAEVLHPLFVIGSFHVLFLQIFPYPSANHRLSHVLLWRLLCENGYGFVEHKHLSPIFLTRAQNYFNTLRQAEKTAYRENWTSLNVWLEFFLDSLLSACRELHEQSTQKLRQFPLSQSQKLILQAIKESGTASRERIARQTGINLSTVKYNLSVLTTKGHLKKIGQGRTTSYRVI